MIEAIELRIGNWIRLYPESEPTKVTGKEINKISYGVYGCYPIPITQEWLDRFGLVAWSSPISASIYGDNIPRIEVNMGHHCEDIDELPHIKYVHQLQNLYFLLTNKEL